MKIRYIWDNATLLRYQHKWSVNKSNVYNITPRNELPMYTMISLLPITPSAYSVYNPTMTMLMEPIKQQYKHLYKAPTSEKMFPTMTQAMKEICIKVSHTMKGGKLLLKQLYGTTWEENRAVWNQSCKQNIKVITQRGELPTMQVINKQIKQRLRHYNNLTGQGMMSKMLKRKNELTRQRREWEQKRRTYLFPWDPGGQ